MWTALTEPLRGKTSLWKVIWIYGFGVSVVYTVWAGSLCRKRRLASVSSTLLTSPWYCSVCGCFGSAPITLTFPSAGRLLRIVVVAGLLTIPLECCIPIRNPEVFDALLTSACLRAAVTPDPIAPRALRYCALGGDYLTAQAAAQAHRWCPRQYARQRQRKTPNG